MNNEDMYPQSLIDEYYYAMQELEESIQEKNAEIKKLKDKITFLNSQSQKNYEKYTSELKKNQSLNEELTDNKYDVKIFRNLAKEMDKAIDMINNYLPTPKREITNYINWAGYALEQLKESKRC